MFLRKKPQILLIVLGVVQLSLLVQGSERIKPNAWGIAKSKRLAEEGQTEAPACPDVLKCDCVEDLGSIYYMKLVNYLFRKSKPILNDFDGKHLISIHLQISEEQLRALRDTENVRDIDAIVSTVIENSRGGKLVQAKEVLLSWYDQLQYLYLRVINSQTVTMSTLLCLFLLSVLSMRYIFKVHIILAIVLPLLCTSLFFKYLDCNRRLEFDNIQRVKSLTTQPNPCENKPNILGWGSSYDSQKCTDYMMSIHGHDRQFCDPTDVVSDFVLAIFWKPFSRFLDTVSGFVDASFSKHGIIKGTLIVLVVMTAMTYWMRDFLKASFGLLWSGLSSSSGTSKPAKPSIKDTEEPAAAAQPNIVNVHINLDPRAIGDYVQQVKRDEEQSRAAICMPKAPPSPESPTKGIENVADGFDVITSEMVIDTTASDECLTPVKEDELKKEK